MILMKNLDIFIDGETEASWGHMTGPKSLSWHPDSLTPEPALLTSSWAFHFVPLCPFHWLSPHMAFQSPWSNQLKNSLHIGCSTIIVILHILIDLSNFIFKRSSELGHFTLTKNRHDSHSPIYISRKWFTLPLAKRAAKSDILFVWTPRPSHLQWSLPALGQAPHPGCSGVSSEVLQSPLAPLGHKTEARGVEKRKRRFPLSFQVKALRQQ